jgi:hypothetical protein
MHTIIGIDPAGTAPGHAGSVITMYQYGKPTGTIHITASCNGPEYSPPDMADSLKALYKCVRCPPHVATKGNK